MYNFNDPIYIRVQLFDGSTSKYIRAYIKDKDGNLIAQKDLTSLGQGVYGADYAMPNEPIVLATLIVYSDSGYTTEDTTYERSMKEFKRNGSTLCGCSIEGEISSVGELTGDVTIIGMVEGTIEADEPVSC